MSWQEEIDELRHRRELARRMGGPANVERQHKAGRLTVRERIAQLLDGDSFAETGSLAGKATYGADGTLESVLPANSVLGTGRIAGRRVVVCGDDFTVRGGAADAAIHAKQVYGERMARELRLPIVRLVDGTGGGGSVKTYEQTGRTYVPGNPGWDLVVAMMSEVPVVAAALGPVAGLGAARVAHSHFSVMVRGVSQVFVAGPPVVERAFGTPVGKEELGGVDIHGGNGTVDNVVDSEPEAFEHIRRFLSYLPPNVWQLPPRATPTDDPGRRDEALLSFIPRNRRRGYDPRTLIGHVADRESFFELGRTWGRSLVTGLARLDGYPVAVVASDPMQAGGALTADGSEKLTRFADLCDTFHLPVVHLVDQPGFLIGAPAERASTIRKGVRALAAVYQATVPWVSIIVRRVFGVAGAGHGNVQALNLRYAWPSGDWGSLPLEGGIEAAYKRELAAAPDRAQLMREIEARLNAVRSPFRAAEVFNIEEIIDPRDTRPLLTDWVGLAYELEATRLGPKTRGHRP
jgi:acetyl-CoA carboxylase carboxyltransferase component